MRLLLAPLLILGCAEPVDLTQADQGLLCSDIWCGMNSSKLGNIYTHEFRTDGRPNDEGFYISKVMHLGQPYEISVENAEFVLRNSTTTLTGQAVVGAQITVKHESGERYTIKIAASSLTPYWIETTAEIRQYLLSYSINDTFEWQNVCSNPPTDKMEYRNMNKAAALVFEGDRVDGKGKTVGEPDPIYFNIGCAGHALAKMALTGHSYPGVKGETLTTPPQRQTFLKMITSDYCGKGTAYTVPGTPLDWIGDQKWMAYFYSHGGIESRWTDKGASCVSRFRLEANGDPTGGGMFPNGVADAVAAECELRECDPDDRDRFEGHYMVTSTPQP